MDRVGCWGQRVNEVGAGEGVLGVASVDAVSGEDGVVTEIFGTHAAEAAGTVCAAHPRDADAGADGECGCSAVYDLADDLVAGDYGLLERRKVALDDVEVGAADSAGEDSQQDVAGANGGRGEIFEAEELAGSGEGRVEDGGLHDSQISGCLCGRQ